MRPRYVAAILIAVLGSVAGLVIARRLSAGRPQPSVRGAVVSANTDPNKQVPVAGVIITAEGLGQVKSDPAGYFQLVLPRRIRPVPAVTLRFQRDGYESLTETVPASATLEVVRLTPIPQQAPPESNKPEVVIGNVTVRYSEKMTTTANIGSAVKTFQVVNKGGVPCQGDGPCSSDGRWKATIGSVTLDAGEGNQFQNARISCIAGPCPFTSVESNDFSKQGRTISVSVRDWSDTTTFLVEAEVFRPLIADTDRNAYPVIFGRTFNFSLPSQSEGASIEAEVNGTTIVFPLGPTLCLSWADCTQRGNSEHAGVYSCELKPGFRF